MNRKKEIFGILFLGILLFVSSCKSVKQPTQFALAEKDKNERLDILLSQAVQYETLSSSLKFSFKPGKKNSIPTVDAQLKIIKDKILQLSLRLPILGIEVARMTVTPDQIIIIDRKNKYYFAESMETVRTIAPFDFDFYSLQALFSNQLFIAGKSGIVESDYSSFSLTEDEYFVYLNNKDSQGINYDFMSDYTNRIQKTEMYKQKEKVHLVWMYQDFGLTSNNRLFPMKMNMELTIPDDIVTMNLAFSTVNINESFNIEANIPAKYKQISFEQIVKLIQSF